MNKATSKVKKHQGKAKDFRMERNTGDKSFSGTTTFEQPSGRGLGPMQYVEPMTTSHADLDAVHDHIDKMFGDDADADGSAAAGTEEPE